MRQLRTSVVAFIGAACVAAGALVAACSESPKLVGEGGACAVTADCDRGLVCVPRTAGARECTSDLSSIDRVPSQPPDAAADTGDADGAGDGASDAISDAPPVDVVVDTNPPPGDAAID